MSSTRVTIAATHTGILMVWWTSEAARIRYTNGNAIGRVGSSDSNNAIKDAAWVEEAKLTAQCHQLG